MQPVAKARAQKDAAPSNPAIMAGWLFVAGATIGQLSLLLPRAPHTNVSALEVNIALAYLGGAAVLLFFRRMPLWTFHFVMLAGTALITRAVYYSGDGVSYYGVWYLWVALFSFSFFSRREATLHVSLAGIAYGVVLAVRHEPVGEARWLTTFASLLIAGMFIDALVRRVRRQRQQAADNAENLATVVEAMQRIFQQTTAEATRADLCSTASGVAGADIAVLWEPRPGARVLTPVATAGAAVVSEELSLTDSSVGAVRAFATGLQSFTCDEAEQGLELQAADREACSCVLWQPVLRNQVPVAVLALYWMTPVGPPEQSVRATIELLAAQAAAAIERVDLLARLRSIAHTDELTGLLNRRAWQEALPREMARAKRESQPLCVAMLDIDGLKALNDNRGHHAGDQRLKQSAAAWSSALRPVDLLARYGGDEFAAVLPGCCLDDAQKVVKRLVDATPSDHSFSVGIAEWDGAEDGHTLMAQADSRLYAAKAMRGRFVVHAA